MEKEFNSVKGFLEDKSFRDWVLKDNCGPHVIWTDWPGRNPDREPLFLEAMYILKNLQGDVQLLDQDRKERVLSGIIKKINVENKSPLRYNTKEDKKNRLLLPWKRLGIAASVAGLCLLAFFHILDILKTDEKPVETEVLSQWVYRANEPGRQSRVTLPDSSVVYLNASSELRYDRVGFGKTHRDLHIRGEAFFEVRQGLSTPFRVFSGGIVTTALGTSFNVVAYSGEPMKIQLATGKVMVSQETERAQPGIFLRPGEEALVHTMDKITIQHIGNMKSLLWREGVLFFDKAPVEDLFLKLERWYGVNINVHGSGYSQLKISAEFRRDFLSNVLESLSYSIDFRYTIRDKEVDIFF
ncbi:FecR family protein [Negadavirga shengliensis]|uniref:FecR family protein n=1 Tax=Negadavirga shengliensis TaxID=1389218 RepID=A0ABV9T3G8_9BACT